ncbi:hypothetical protein A3Q56_07985 [Intoshia linei]|uniref:Elongation of very long chain fatty acids protein n=1 Tax=Intoshia linei TaxID=1819745 RepID=A0A177AQN8_9BILA|nr:hypothetical protein A3Q56_07985 [Intoshia linei]
MFTGNDKIIASSEVPAEVEEFMQRQWVGMSSIIYPIFALVAYFAICNVGILYMKDRKEYALKKFLRIYNCALVIASAYICIQILTNSPNTDKGFVCRKINVSKEYNRDYRLASAIYWYHITKYVEFIDSFLFILRKKFNQLSVLHRFHHSSMPLLSWISLYYIPSASVVPGIFLNSFIHFLMYSYYFFSSFGPKYTKYLWWKRYLTRLQIAQFFIIVFLSVQGIMKRCFSTGGVVYAIIMSTYNIVLICLFSNFYVKSYFNRNDAKPILNKESFKKIN